MRKRIIIWKEVLILGNSIIEKVLAFLIEIYLNTDEERVFASYNRLADGIKKNRYLEYSMLTDFGNNLPNIGGFRRCLLDKWSGYLDFASADIISSYVTGYNFILNKRSSLLSTILEIFDQDIRDLVRHRRENDIEYIKEMIPDEYATKLCLFSIFMENKQGTSQYILLKYKVEIEMYRYISYLFYIGKLRVKPNTYQYENEYLIERLLAHSYTLYSSDIKLDCGLI